MMNACRIAPFALYNKILWKIFYSSLCSSVDQLASAECEDVALLVELLTEREATAKEEMEVLLCFICMCSRMILLICSLL